MKLFIVVISEWKEKEIIVVLVYLTMPNKYFM